MNKELAARHRHKKEVFWRWKQVQVSGGLQRCCLVVEIFRKAKAHLEVNMATHVNTNVEGFHKDNSSETKTRENVAPLLKWSGSPVTKATEVLNVFFTSLFTGIACSQ